MKTLEIKRYGKDMSYHKLAGKRLLVLGGANNAPDLKSFADKECVKLIFAGLSFSKYISEIADETYNLDILDRNEVIALIKNQNIDGVFVGGNENIISCVIDVTEQLGLPFYCNREVWDNVMNKREFKRFCREYGVPTMDDYEIDSENLHDSAERLSYPVVIKPVDNCGSCGVNKCECKEDFPRLYTEAREKSRTKQVTVENFVDGFEIVVYYTFVNGNVTLSSMGDKYVRGNVDSFIPLSEIYAYPSKYLSLYQRDIDEKMRTMLKGMGIKNGITSMQGFVKDGKFVFFEMGFRLGGTAQYRYTEAINGINSLHMMMTLALTGEMGGYDQTLDNPMFKSPCCTLTLMSKGGTVAKIEGVDEARKIPEVLHIENRYDIGDTIAVTRTVSQFHIRIFIMARNIERMKFLINYLQDNIKVYDTEGENMLITKFDTETLSFGDNIFTED